MRIITQDKNTDFPIDNFIISLIGDTNIICYNTVEGDNYIPVAKYSTQEKVLKAMEMLRNEYLKNGSENVYFQFPTDEELTIY